MIVGTGCKTSGGWRVLCNIVCVCVASLLCDMLCEIDANDFSYLFTKFVSNTIVPNHMKSEMIQMSVIEDRARSALLKCQQHTFLTKLYLLWPSEFHITIINHNNFDCITHWQLIRISIHCNENWWLQIFRGIPTRIPLDKSDDRTNEKSFPSCANAFM